MKNKKEKAQAANTKNLVVLLVVLCVMLLLGASIRALTTDKVTKLEPRVKQLERYQKKHKSDEVTSWLQVQGTNIDYPVVTDEADVQFDESDIDTLWQVGNLEQLNRVNTVLGHNVMNLSSNPLVTDKNHKKFEQLMSYVYTDFAKENQFISLTVGKEEYVFQIFAVGFYDYNQFETINSLNNNDDEYVKNELELIKERTIYDYDVEVNEKDTLLHLVTCSRFYGNVKDKTAFRVSAKLLKTGAKQKLANVKENENYKEIKEIMKGGSNNETQA